MSATAHASKRRSQDEWQHLITEQQSSQLSQKAYCQEHGLVLSTFQYWKRKLVSVGLPVSQADTWLELPSAVDGSLVAGWDIELELGNGICLRLKQH
jgi:hypothetical protein